MKRFTAFVEGRRLLMILVIIFTALVLGCEGKRTEVQRAHDYLDRITERGLTSRDGSTEKAFYVRMGRRAKSLLDQRGSLEQPIPLVAILNPPLVTVPSGQQWFVLEFSFLQRTRTVIGLQIEDDNGPILEAPHLFQNFVDSWEWLPGEIVWTYRVLVHVNHAPGSTARVIDGPESGPLSEHRTRVPFVELPSTALVSPLSVSLFSEGKWLEVKLPIYMHPELRERALDPGTP